MLNQQETNSNIQIDKFAEALAAARKMQQEWLNFGLDFVHLYVEDVNGDWLENWGNDNVINNFFLDSIKEFLVSDDAVAVKVKQHLQDRSLFEFAVNLEEYWRTIEESHRLSAVRDLLVGKESQHNMTSHLDNRELWDLADKLLSKIAEIS